MKLAIGYSTKDQVELTEQTFKHIRVNFIWADGSTTEEGKAFFEKYRHNAIDSSGDVRGGADAAIAWKLSKLLALPDYYTHLGLLENDVLLDPDWLEPTLELFEKGKQDGLEVGAVSPRSYVDRILIQRDGYAVMHNIGAGAIIFTRKAAEIVLRTFRTHWWPDNVRLFAQLSGIDLRTYACFRGNDQFVTTDWGFEAQLARCGLASLALTPAKCTMIGQNPPLEQQSLTLTTQLHNDLRADGDTRSFELYRESLAYLRNGGASFESPGMIHRDGASMLFFPHQLKAIGASWFGSLELQWAQGFGPFAYRAGEGDMSLYVHVSGPCSFLISGGAVGAGVIIEDRRSGFKVTPNLPPEADHPISIQVPGGPVPRKVIIDLEQGAVFYGLACNEPQMIDITFKFDWSQLPKAV